MEDFPDLNKKEDKESNGEISLDEQISVATNKFKIADHHKKWFESHILNQDDPEGALREVENTLNNQNVSEVDKRMLMFKIMFPKERIEKAARSGISPYLKQEAFKKEELFDIEKFYEIIRRDLLKVYQQINSEESIREAQKRGLDIAKQIKGGSFKFEKGGLVRGVLWRRLAEIIKSGDISSELKGWNSFPDIYSVFDVDFFRLEEDVTSTKFENKYVVGERERNKKVIGYREETGPSDGNPWYYGEIVFYIRDRGQFGDSDSLQKFELFENSNGVSGNHVGVRVGYPSTEIDLIICSASRLEFVRKALDENGWYIPVVDKELNLIYTPEMYEMAKNPEISLKKRILSIFSKSKHPDKI